MKRAIVFVVSIHLLCLLSGCSTVEDSVALALLESTEVVAAVEFPELIMTDHTGSEREIKILSVRGRMVTVAPFPYWLLEPFEIPLNQIRSLKVKRQSYPEITVTLAIMEAGFMMTGGIAGGFAESREQYGLAIVAGLGGALLGFGAAFFSDVWELGEDMYPEHYLAGMDDSEKLLTILRLMGAL
jgi:hypothetical protein